VDIGGRLISVLDFQSNKTTDDSVDAMFDEELAEGADDRRVLKGAVADKDVSDEDNPFDDDMDEDLLAGVDGEDEGEISISKIKAMTGFIASSDKEDVYVGIDKARALAGIKKETTGKPPKNDDDDDNVSVSSLFEEVSRPAAAGSSSKSRIPSSFVIPFSEPQKPFQPSSTPEHLEHRFMV
jgi:hypothetical protein